MFRWQTFPQSDGAAARGDIACGLDNNGVPGSFAMPTPGGPDAASP